MYKILQNTRNYNKLPTAWFEISPFLAFYWNSTLSLSINGTRKFIHKKKKIGSEAKYLKQIKKQ